MNSFAIQRCVSLLSVAGVVATLGCNDGQSTTAADSTINGAQSAEMRANGQGARTEIDQFEISDCFLDEFPGETFEFCFSMSALSRITTTPNCIESISSVIDDSFTFSVNGEVVMSDSGTMRSHGLSAGRLMHVMHERVSREMINGDEVCTFDATFMVVDGQVRTEHATFECEGYEDEQHGLRLGTIGCFEPPTECRETLEDFCGPEVTPDCVIAYGDFCCLPSGCMAPDCYVTPQCEPPAEPCDPNLPIDCANPECVRHPDFPAVCEPPMPPCDLALPVDCGNPECIVHPDFSVACEPPMPPCDYAGPVDCRNPECIDHPDYPFICDPAPRPCDFAGPVDCGNPECIGHPDYPLFCEPVPEPCDFGGPVDCANPDCVGHPEYPIFCGRG